MSKLEKEAQTLWKHYEPLQKQLHELEVAKDTNAPAWKYKTMEGTRCIQFVILRCFLALLIPNLGLSEIIMKDLVDKWHLVSQAGWSKLDLIRI